MHSTEVLEHVIPKDREQKTNNGSKDASRRKQSSHRHHTDYIRIENFTCCELVRAYVGDITSLKSDSRFKLYSDRTGRLIFWGVRHFMKSLNKYLLAEATERCRVGRCRGEIQVVVVSKNNRLSQEQEHSDWNGCQLLPLYVTTAVKERELAFARMQRERQSCERNW